MNLSRLTHHSRGISKVIAHIERFFKPFPHFPPEFSFVALDLLPAIVLALGILNTTMGAIIITTYKYLAQSIFVPSGVVDPTYVLITGMLAIANGLLMVLSYPEIHSRKKVGWMSLFVILLITIIQAVLAFIFHQSGVIGTWIYAIVAFYFAFELKPYFRD